MAVTRNSTSQVPYSDKIFDSAGLISFSWGNFFRWVFDSLSPLGSEKYFALKNYVTTTTPLPMGAIAGPLNVDDLQFDHNKVNSVFVDYLIQRVSKNPSATELIEAGTLRIVYKPRSASWVIAKLNNGPDTSGITFTITASGQVQYTSTNISGTIVVQKLTYRARTLAAKVIEPSGGWT